MHRRRLVLSVVTGLILASTVTPDVASAGRAGVPAGSSPYASQQTKPSGPNPFLAFLPDTSRVDFIGWQRWLEAQGDQRRAQMDAAQAAQLTRPPLLVDEDEPEGLRGSNDTVQTAQPVPGFGTAAGRNPRARLLGSLAADPVVPVAIPPNVEDDGSLPLARDTGISATGGAITTSGRIGDGPHGRAGTGTGDFDWYEVHARAGQTLAAQIDAQNALFPVMVVFDENGTFLNFFVGDGELRFPIRVAGTYFVHVAGFPTFQNDPFDSGSGNGVTTQGPYNLAISLTTDDVDHYAVHLRKGDVVGASVEGAATTVSIYSPTGQEVHGSAQDASFIYPAASPLPGGGNAVTDHVAERTGWHTVAVSSGVGRYDVTVEAYRPPLETEQPVQTLFLDFDGERVNTGIWGGPGVRTLSPMRAFLGRWGLTNADYNRVVDRIIAVVRENLKTDMLATGLNPDFRLRIRNSRDHADPFGQPNVSRVIVGGTINESGIPTIGVAQSIDPGNFEHQESAVVLLDSLSEPPGPAFSVNTYLRPQSDRVGFVAQAVGNIVAHEAGHFFGNWHVDPFNTVANLMDSGGNPRKMFGVGPDVVGGTADDRDVDFGKDVFDPFEGFTGTEDTLARLVFTLTG